MTELHNAIYPVKRFWFYKKENWEPALRHQFGWPYLGGDEWGRRTIVIGTRWTGAIVIALWTCWCTECHVGRAQTYQDTDSAIANLLD